MNRNELLFEESQHFNLPRLKVFLTSVGTVSVGLLLYGVYTQVVLGRPFGANPGPTWLLVVGVVFQALLFGVVLSMLYRMKMETGVRDGVLEVRFKPLLKRNIVIDRIVSFEVRTYRPIREYGGWGMRMGLFGYGRAYNAYGNRGVQMVLAGGEKLLIGSQRPEELAEAIRRAKTR